MAKFPELITLKSLKTAAFGAAALSLAACSAQERVHGYVPEDIDLESVLPGVDTISSLETSIGRPSSSGLVRGNAWYYVKTTVRHYTYNRPEVTDREVLAIRFDDQGVVKDVNRYGLEDGRIIDLKRDITVTHGQTLTALGQILGNFGRIDPSQILQSDG